MSGDHYDIDIVKISKIFASHDFLVFQMMGFNILDAYSKLNMPCLALTVAVFVVTTET